MLRSMVPGSSQASFIVTALLMTLDLDRFKLSLLM